MRAILFFTAGLLLLAQGLWAQHTIKLAALRYSGGGDWYANPTALTNLIAFANAELGTGIDPEYEVVEVGSPEIFNYPFVHMTGHGNVVWSEDEQRNLRQYLEAGGFLHIDDNYGMDKFVRPLLQNLWPGIALQPLPSEHSIFQQAFSFPQGLPKIHEHDNQPPEAWGLFYQGRLVVLYTYQTDLGDGWEDPEVHNDPPEVRQKALRMGANILQYVFKGEL